MQPVKKEGIAAIWLWLALLSVLVSCAGNNKETASDADSTAATAMQPATGSGTPITIVSAKATLYSGIGSGEETPLSGQADLQEKGPFQLFNGQPDFWYKVRTGDGKVGWIFGASTDKQIPTDQRWDNLYNLFAKQYGLDTVNLEEGVATAVDLILKSETDNGNSFLLLLTSAMGDETEVNLLLVDASGNKIGGQQLKGVFKYKPDNKLYELTRNSPLLVKGDLICFDYGSLKYENGNQVLNSRQECYELDGRHVELWVP